ncbi:SpoIIE family protein phosphatase [Nocardioides sp. Y6]|uniref:SpoIIE family protein phosphatase n=1 Tax=Nocardioides malaquae TaxID=2773426 RepID=A0ABR9RQP9_9ACTN|nr:SpoIIE family protein phosphatase [Nocardioides malaquae]MBE7323522.1 SpoIIE family protein phosphatase [Nocardioides malaquae]
MDESQEQARVQALRELHLLDTGPEERFDQVVRLAQRLFDVPKVAVNLVDTDRQFTKSAVGLDLGDTPRELSFCTHTVAEADALVVTDPAGDARFADHPDVENGTIGFYVGHPLSAPGGEVVGALCLVDDTPRAMSEQELDLLAGLARWVERELAFDADEVQAREVQRRLLPYRRIEVPGYELAGCCLPARHVGGDYFDWMELDGRLQLVVADVMGKGLTAAALTAGIRSMMRVSSSFNPLAEAVRRTAVGMDEDFTETSTFATLFACRITPATGEIEYVDAGHGLALVVPPEGPARQLASSDLPLGTLPHDSWTPHLEALRPGETLFIVSDGVLDVLPEQAAVIEAATRLVRDLGSPDAIVARVEEFVRANELEDDLTVVVVRRLPS